MVSDMTATPTHTNPDLTGLLTDNAYLAGLLEDIADWLAKIGYPLDFTDENLPPAEFRQFIEEAWIRREEGYTSFVLDDQDAANLAQIVAEAGGWAAQS